MKSRNHFVEVFCLAILSSVLLVLSANAVSAQANQPLRLSFVGAGGGPPTVVVADGNVIFKITVFETVSGDVAGTLTEKVTQVYPLTDEEGLLPITTSWKLVTPDGTIEGYYTGLFNHMMDGTHMIVQHGEVLSVTGAYVRLYQGKVTYQATLLADHMTISGAMTIYSREAR